jgi:hypothetical protein
MKRLFVPHNFALDGVAMIETINGILDEYAGQGFVLSLRQLYYQLVARDLIPNTVRSYKNTGVLVSDARLAGLIDWDMIEDRGRQTVAQSHWRNPAQIVDAAAHQFCIDKWVDQAYRIEVMVEKDALSGVLEPVCRELDVAITANKGYSSSSTMHEIGQRLARYAKYDQRVVILYLGDHDPSGIDMTRDVAERLALFSGLAADQLEVVRLALNMAQIEQWRPPENPAKETDARFAAYQAEFGESSWELDAIEPAALADLVREAVFSRRDIDLYEAQERREAVMRERLLAFVRDYKYVED